jgi:hypothetical protein
VREQLAEIAGKEVLLVSAVTGQGLNQLLHRMAEELSKQHQVV